MFLSTLFLLLVLTAADAAPSSWIVNGETATPHSWPWQLSLRLGNNHRCGASILNSTHAVTAAHCVDGASAGDLLVWAGTHNFQNNEPTRQVRYLRSYKMHPDYNPNASGFPNDVAVMEFTSPLDMNTEVQTANLVTDDSNNFAGNSNCFITGWGRLQGGGSLPNELQEAQTTVLSPTNCRNILRNAGLQNALGEDHVCVHTGGNGGCNGDSGGPLVCMHEGLYRLVGAASWVVGSCLTSYPTVYVRLSKFLDFIN